MLRNIKSRLLGGLGLSILLVLTSGTSCQSGAGGSSDGTTRISGVMQNCYGDSMRLYEYLGGSVRVVGSGKLEKNEDGYAYTIEPKGIDHAGLYLLGPDPQNNIGVIVTPGKSFVLSADCNSLTTTSKFSDSPENDGYNQYMARVSQMQNRSNQLMQELQQLQYSNPGAMAGKQEEMNTNNAKYYEFIDSVKTAGGFLGKIAAIYSFKPYMSDPSHSAYPDETAYFKDNFFKDLDLSDPALNHIPQLVDKTKFFAANMASRGLPAAEIQAVLDGNLAKTVAGTPARRMFYQGIIDGLDQVKSDLYIDFGKKFTAEYPADPMSSGINQRIASMEMFRSGAGAPELAGQTPVGGQLKLSDLRGKVVLVDFWASWCRPCRMENPNVKKAYAKYAPKGFEILGVSLDNMKEKWVQAIDQDGLPWKHISDLRGWQSEHAQLYGVNSIPATFLLDKEGKIIAKNLRGPALEAKLAEIFGS